MCGPPLNELPDNSSYPNLVGQLIEVIIQFWKNGGALVFWAEGEPLFYQVNLFLEQNGFDFKIEGNHQGRQFLLPDDSNDLQNRQTFNRHPQGDEEFVAYVYESEGLRLTNYIRTCARSNIYFSGINICHYGIPTFNKVGEIYVNEGKRNLFTILSISSVGEDIAGNFLQNVADNLISSIAAF